MTTDEQVEGVILKLLGDFQSVLTKGTEDKAYKIISDALKQARREALMEASTFFQKMNEHTERTVAMAMVIVTLERMAKEGE